MLFTSLKFARSNRLNVSTTADLVLRVGHDNAALRFCLIRNEPAANFPFPFRGVLENGECACSTEHPMRPPFKDRALDWFDWKTKRSRTVREAHGARDPKEDPAIGSIAEWILVAPGDGEAFES